MRRSVAHDSQREDHQPPGPETDEASSAERTAPEPWPDGPRCQVDEAFQEVCLQGVALPPLMRTRPDVAREVILALVIEEPRSRRDPWANQEPLLADRVLHVQYLPVFRPPFYTNGPFLAFFSASGEHAVDAVIRLVEHATNQWAGHVGPRAEQVPHVRIILDGEEKTFWGDFRVFTWYRGAGAWSSDDVVSSALMALEKWLYDSLDAGRPINHVVKRILEQSTSVALIGMLCEVGRFRPALFGDVLLPILGVAEIYLWELLYFKQGLDSLWELSTSYVVARGGQSFYQQIKAWEFLPHRRVGVLKAAMSLFLEDTGQAAFFVAAVEHWRKRLAEGVDDEHLRDQLETLVVYFDRENWSEEQVPDVGTVLMFTAPAHLQERAAAARREHEKPLQLLMFPVQCRRRLNEGAALPEDELEGFWAELQQIASPEGLQEIDPNWIPDCVCGGVAVLVKLHRAWLRSHPEREAWCVGQLEKTVLSPPPPGEFDCEESISDYHWDHFASEITPILWAGDPSSRSWRKLVAILATAWHYKAVGLLMRAAFEVRSQLGEAFGQLVSFLLRWAVVRSGLRRHWNAGTERVDVNKWFKKEGRAFVEGRVPTAMPEWGEQAVKDGRRCLRASHRSPSPDPVFRTYPHIDRTLIQYAFGGILLLDQAETPSERSEWLVFWDQALMCSLASIQSFDRKGELVDSDEREAGLPCTCDYWVLDRTSLTILTATPDEDPRRFWEPILQLGPWGHHWVEAFLEELFRIGLLPAHVQRFKVEWQQMLEFGGSSDLWAVGESPHWSHVRGVWSHLMGIDYRSADCWQEEHQGIVTEMRSFYLRWAEANLCESMSAKLFVQWLKRPAADPIRIEATISMRDAAASADDYWWREEHLVRELAELLDACWRRNASELREASSADAAFKELLKMVADRQEPLAMDLQERIAAGE